MDDTQTQDQNSTKVQSTVESGQAEKAADSSVPAVPAQPSGPLSEPELAPPAPAVIEAEKEENAVNDKPENEPELAPPAPAVVTPEVVTESQEDKEATEETVEITPAVPSDADRLAPDPTPIATATPSGPKARWYVVHTYSGHEAKVAATLKQRVASQKLEDKVLDIMVPTQDKIEIREGKKAKIKEKIFPGYMLIKMILDDNTWLIVRTTPGITSFVGMGNKPTPLPDQEVATIQKYMTMEAPKFKASFSVGEAVKITDGPFSEFLGSISEIDDARGKLKVLVSIFGRETPVELDFLQVGKL